MVVVVAAAGVFLHDKATNTIVQMALTAFIREGILEETLIFTAQGEKKLKG